MATLLSGEVSEEHSTIEQCTKQQSQQHWLPSDVYSSAPHLESPYRYVSVASLDLDTLREKVYFAIHPLLAFLAIGLYGWVLWRVWRPRMHLLVAPLDRWDCDTGTSVAEYLLVVSHPACIVRAQLAKCTAVGMLQGQNLDPKSRWRHNVETSEEA